VRAFKSFEPNRAVGAACMATLLAAVIWTPALAAKPARSLSGSASGYVMQRQSGPSRTVVSTGAGTWVATFTDGARTVALAGPKRTFGEPTTTSATVTTSVWVRLLATPFTGSVNTTWLDHARVDTSADVLATAMQYIAGAPTISNSTGVRIAGDADYGPLQADGSRSAGADFNDFLGVSWNYASGTVDAPEASELGALDCSGFMRMLFGYRGGVPLVLTPDGGKSLPRHSWEIAESGPGVVVIPNSGAQPSSRAALQAGDIVAFDASTTDGTRIDHVGMFLGRDSAGHDRFISSRITANGPTLGDLGGRSSLDGTGLYALSFRSARRV